MDYKLLQQQLENAKELVSTIHEQNRIFEHTLKQAIKGANKEDKPEIERVTQLAQRAINLAKQGKSDQAQQIIKDFKPKHGSKNN